MHRSIIFYRILTLLASIASTVPENATYFQTWDMPYVMTSDNQPSKCDDRKWQSYQLKKV